MIRATNLKARLWWWLLPYAGSWAYRDCGPEDGANPTRWWDAIGAAAWRAVGLLPGRVFA